ncbi:unnamed protein product [Rodentolepis nana]|uniref:DUF4258 domain-containing protein n=1 Tax=Rodentolepis nana TaxID=102285 RepID=A0A0R3TX04_RODNA|nr:unnamed protein product [Rodentolepis nana]
MEALIRGEFQNPHNEGLNQERIHVTNELKARTKEKQWTVETKGKQWTVALSDCNELKVRTKEKQWRVALYHIEEK